MINALLILLVAMLSIQSGASLAKNLFGLMSPEGISTLRLLFAAILLNVIWRPWRSFRDLNKKNWRDVALYGLSLGAMNILFYMSLARIPLGLAVAFEFLGPLALALFHSRRLKDLIWVALAATGVLLLLPLADDRSSVPSLDLVGVFLAVAAGACWALYIVFGQKSGSGLHGGVVTALGMSFGALFLLPVGLIVEGPTQLFRTETLLLALAVALLSSAIPYSLEMFALKRLPTKMFSILMSLEPAVAAVMGFLILHEVLTITQWLAIALIITASVGVTMSANRSPA